MSLWWEQNVCLSVGKSKEDPSASVQPKRQKNKQLTNVPCFDLILCTWTPVCTAGTWTQSSDVNSRSSGSLKPKRQKTKQISDLTLWTWTPVCTAGTWTQCSGVKGNSISLNSIDNRSVKRKGSQVKEITPHVSKQRNLGSRHWQEQRRSKCIRVVKRKKNNKYAVL